jgi:hypothetical protein
VLDATEAVSLVDDISKDRNVRSEWARLARIVDRTRGKHPAPYTPDSADAEYKDLVRRAVSNWLPLVVASTVQGLFVDGFRGDDEEASKRRWETWQANGMDARQVPLHRAVCTLGYSYVVVLPAEDGGTVSLSPVPATRMHAVYEFMDDEWPKITVRDLGGDRWELLDDEARYVVTGKAKDRKVTTIGHGLGVTPVVKLSAQYDLHGYPMGDVEPLLPVQERINETVFGLLMAQRYAAFKQRWITGMAPPLDADGNPLPLPFNTAVDSVMIAESVDSKFGQFDASDLGQYVEALEAHVRHLAAISQTPPHYLLGSLVNLSAEALTAAETGLQRKIRERQMVLGEGYEQMLRLVARAEGDNEDASAQVHWRDTESRSLSQVADALNKLAGPDGLGVPAEMLFEMIPGWSAQDVDRAVRLRADAAAPLEALMQGLADPTPAVKAMDPADLKARADAMGVLIRAGVSTDSAAAQAGLSGVQFTGAVPVSLRLPEGDAATLEG